MYKIINVINLMTKCNMQDNVTSHIEMSKKKKSRYLDEQNV